MHPRPTAVILALFFVAIGSSAAAARPEEPLPRDAVLADLRVAERALQEQWSYRDANDIDLGAAFAAVREAVPDDGLTPAQLADALQRILCLGPDGHAGVRGMRGARPAGFLPCLFVPVDGRVAAVQADRSGVLDPARPFVVSIDGTPIEQWIAAVEPYVADASPLMARERALRELRWIRWAGTRLGHAVGDALFIEVADAAGTDGATLRLPLADARPIYGAWPRDHRPTLPEGVGYVRLERMSRSAATDVVAQLDALGDATAVIIDVRGNGGGTRDAMRAVVARLLAPDAPPLVVNIARPIVHDALDPDRLPARTLHEPQDDALTEAERAAITAVLESFAPAWAPDDPRFGAWHACVVTPAPPEVTHFHDVPVVVLQDETCFSATDIFLGAVERLPNVTLVGRTSGGGSAATTRVALPNSALEIAFGSMASYRVNGARYDGVGVAPDVAVTARVTDFVADGTDSILDAALDVIRAAP